MPYVFSKHHSPIALLLVVLFSGIPIPLLDSHPTDCSSIGDNILLREHLASTPIAEHTGVSDAELHIHWVSPLVSSNSAVTRMSPDTMPTLHEVTNPSEESLELYVVVTWLPISQGVRSFLPIGDRQSNISLVKTHLCGRLTV